MVVKARGGGLITIISPNPAIFRNLCFSAHSQYQVFFPAFPRFFYSFLCPVLRINSPLPGRETSLLVNCILFWGWFLTNWPPLAFLSHFGGGGHFWPTFGHFGLHWQFRPFLHIRGLFLPLFTAFGPILATFGHFVPTWTDAMDIGADPVRCGKTSQKFKFDFRYLQMTNS